MKIYLSGSFNLRQDIALLARELKSKGFEVTSSWLSEPEVRFDDAATEEWARRARANEDVEDIRRSDALIVFTRVPSTSGGLYWELGYADALGLDLYVVGPVLNVFMLRSKVNHYRTFAELLDDLLKQQHAEHPLYVLKNEHSIGATNEQ